MAFLMVTSFSTCTLHYLSPVLTLYRGRSNTAHVCMSVNGCCLYKASHSGVGHCNTVACCCAVPPSCKAAHHCAQADNRIGDSRCLDMCTKGDDCVIHCAVVNACWGQVPWACQHRAFIRVAELKVGWVCCQIEVGIEERLDGANVFPVPIKQVGLYFATCRRLAS